MKRHLSSLVLVTVITIAAAQFSPAQSQRMFADAERISGDNFSYTTRTRMGASVYSVKPASAALLNAIDTGLNALFAAARTNGYSKKLKASDYNIFIANADRTKNAAGEYSPDIAIGAAQYAGSVYDQGGFIYAAGIIVSNKPLAFMIAEHTKNFERVSEAVRNEGEHLVLYHNDRSRYRATADHSRGGGHPILP
ncbi:MAG: hypothetical protein HS105_10115 [Chloracidobacterium sp.]|nr:hypothetical protein [Chloracidobacterium sp.]MCO5333719.1 hypothetical protein [Pyrinomonadaceae bacterium]